MECATRCHFIARRNSFVRCHFSMLDTRQRQDVIIISLCNIKTKRRWIGDPSFGVTNAANCEILLPTSPQTLRVETISIWPERPLNSAVAHSGSQTGMSTHATLRWCSFRSHVPEAYSCTFMLATFFIKARIRRIHNFLLSKSGVQCGEHSKEIKLDLVEKLCVASRALGMLH